MSMQTNKGLWTERNWQFYGKPLSLGLLVLLYCELLVCLRDLSHMHPIELYVVQAFYLLFFGYITYERNKTYKREFIYKSKRESHLANLLPLYPRVNEPLFYEIEYFPSRNLIWYSLFLGILFTILGIGMFVVQTKTYATLKLLLRESIMLPAGCYLIYISVSKLRDKTPALRIGKEGIWTQKFGFSPWNEIHSAKIVPSEKNKQTKDTLEIFYTSNLTKEPDEMIPILGLKKHATIPILIGKYGMRLPEL